MVLALPSVVSAREWHSDPRAVEALADGTGAHPFRTISAALEHADAGDVVRLHTGLFTERIHVAKDVRIVGGKAVVIASPEKGGTVVTLEVPARVESLHVQGGDVGVDLPSGGTLVDVSFSAQHVAAVRALSGTTQLSGGRVTALFDSTDLVGLDLSRGATAKLEGTHFEGPFKFALRSAGGTLTANGIDVEGARSGLSCTSDCTATVTRSSFSQGRGAGLLAGAATLTARENTISQYEQGIVLNVGATGTLVENATANCQLTGVAAFGATLTLRDHLHVGPATTAAVELVNSHSHLEGGELLDPGVAGIDVRQGEASVRSTLVRAARRDADGDFGNALQVAGGAVVEVVDASFEGNAGSGIEVHGSEVSVRGGDIDASGGPGILAAARGRVQLYGTSISRSVGPGLVAIEGSAVVARRERLVNNSEGPVAADCANGAAISTSAGDACRALPK